MTIYNNYASLLNQLSTKELEEIGIILHYDGSLSNLPALPIAIPDKPLETTIDEAERFAINNLMPWEYGRPTLTDGTRHYK